MAGSSQTQIDTVITGDTTGFVKSIQDAEKEMKNFESIIQSIESKINNLGKASIKVPKGMSSVKLAGGGQFVGSQTNAQDAAQLASLNNEILKEEQEYLKQLKQQTASMRADNALKRQAVKRQKFNNQHAQEILNNKTLVSEGYYGIGTHALINAEADRQLSTEKANWLKFKRENPQLWANRAEDLQRQMGMMLSSTGGYMSSQWGTPGKLLGGTMQVVGTRMTTGRIAAFSPGLTLATKGLMDFSKASVQAYGEIQSIKTQLSVVMGSDVQANNVFGEISQYAIKSPFGIEQTSELATLLKQSGVYATDLMDTLKMLGDTAGGNMEKMKRIANNYAQIVSIGKASMLDMRQFAYAGIPIFEAVSKELGVSQQQLRKLISDGKVTADIVEKVFKDLTGVNGIFENATAKGATTLKARMQNMKDAKQLMLSNIGEGIINYGETYGNDSLALKGVSWAEEVYQGLTKWSERLNLEHKLDVIANRGTGPDDIEQDRATMTQAYKSFKEYNDSLKNTKQSYGVSDNSFLSKIQGGWRGAGASIWSAVLAYLAMIDTGIDVSTLGATKLGKGAWKNVKDWGDMAANLFAAMGNYKEITPEMEFRNKESENLLSQQAGSDLINKYTDASLSGYNTASEIVAAMAKTPEAIEQQKNEQLARWTETINILKKIATVQDESGNVDFTKLKPEQLMEYMAKGYFSAERKLNIVENKSADLMARDKVQLYNQYSYINGAISDTIKKSGLSMDIAEELDNIGADLNYDLEPKEFLAQFTELFYKQNDYLNGLLEKSTDKNERDALTKVLNLLRVSTLVLSSDTKGKDANAEDLLNEKTKTKDFTPLWKRILSQYTGISTEAMSGNANWVMENYRDKVAPRQTTANVITAMLNRGGGVQDVRNLLVGGDGKVLKGTNTATAQIDWTKTIANVKTFAMQLSASTDIIDSYTNGLQSQYQTYIDLLAHASTDMENSEITNLDEQTVNAFGEKLLNTNGEVISKIVNGVAYGENGEALKNSEISAESTESLYQFLEKELPNIRRDIQEANKVAGQNRFLNKYEEQLRNYETIENLIKSGKFSGSDISLFKDNSELIDNELKLLLENPENDVLFSDWKTIDDVYADAINGSANAQQRVKWAAENAKDNITTEMYDIFNKSNEQSKLIKLQEAYLGLSPDKYTYSTNWFTGTKATPINPGKSPNLDTFTDAILSKSVMNWAGMGDVNFSELAEQYKNIEKSSLAALVAQQALTNSMKEFSSSIYDIGLQATQSSLSAVFASWAESIFDSSEAADNLQEKMKSIGADMLSQVGTAMANAGYQIAAAGAMEHNWGAVLSGLGLAAAGGFSSGLGSYLSNAENESDTTDSKLQKLESLKDQLTDLLEQARNDALYYENNLQHRNALSVNSTYSNKIVSSINDGIVSPSGNIISTNPKDYIIATKNLQSLAPTVRSNNNVQVIVNNNSSAHVKIEQRQTADGSIQVLATLEEAFGNYIASDRSDEAFSARSIRKSGNHSTMS